MMRNRKWDKQKIIRRIQQWHRAGVPTAKLYRQDPALASSAAAIFGSWRASLRAAGLESERQTWSRERVVCQLRQRHREGASADSRLTAAALRYFGTVRAARAAAGLPAHNRLPPTHHWSRAEVLQEIRRRHEAGGSVSLRTTCRENPSLYAAAKRLFSTWNAARAAAGYPRATAIQLSAEEVLERIKQRHAAGKSLRYQHLDDQVLGRSARRTFGSWGAALHAAGLGDGPPRRWSKRAVVNEIRKRRDHGHTLSRTWREDKPLFRAAVRYFGSWEAAMGAAGFAPRPRERWSKKRVIERLRACAERNRGRNFRDLDPNLTAAAARIFGSYSAALDAAGVEPSPRRWTNARVVAAIQDRYVSGHALHVDGLGDLRLANAAKRRFGSWRAAVEAAGLSGKIPIKAPLRRWTPNEVLAEIQAWDQSGRRVTEISKANQSLYNAAKTHFGTWGAAMAAAGFGPTRRAWSKQAVIDEILQRVRTGQSLSSGDPSNRNLAAVAHRYFGSWRKAIHAAGASIQQDDRRRA